VTAELRRILVRIALLVGATGVGFLLLEQWTRQCETAAALDLLHLFRMSGATRNSPTSIAVHTSDGELFAAVLTPSCSSLATLLALAGLMVLRPPGTRRRGADQSAAALIVVFAGNIIRIAASVAVGLVDGVASQVLFHDWVGSLFGFAYTLGGFLLMLYFLLPRDGIPLTELCAPAAAPARDGESLDAA
jgi:exosortase/archaeosortase family protein